MSMKNTSSFVRTAGLPAEPIKKRKTPVVKKPEKAHDMEKPDNNKNPNGTEPFGAGPNWADYFPEEGW